MLGNQPSPELLGDQPGHEPVRCWPVAWLRADSSLQNLGQQLQGGLFDGSKHGVRGSPRDLAWVISIAPLISDLGWERCCDLDLPTARCRRVWAANVPHCAAAKSSGGQDEDSCLACLSRETRTNSPTRTRESGRVIHGGRKADLTLPCLRLSRGGAEFLRSAL